MSVVAWIIFVLAAIVAAVLAVRGVWLFRIARSYEIPNKPGSLGFKQAQYYRSAMFSGFGSCFIAANMAIFWDTMTYGYQTPDSLIVFGILWFIGALCFAYWILSIGWQNNEEARALEEAKFPPSGPCARFKSLLGGRIKIPMPLRREDWE